MNDNTKTLSKNNQICPVCNIPAKQKCGGCNGVFYCGREHQKADWKFHAKNCCPYKLVIDPTIGKRYVATRNLEIDEIVLCEDKPLLLLPPGPEKVVCLNCYIELTSENMRECDNCGWHLCLNCAKHEGPECELTLKYRKARVTHEKCVSILGQYASAIVIVLRALALRDNDPEGYRRFVEKEDHRVEEAKRSMEKPGRNWAAKRIKEYMNIDDTSEKEIAKIIGVYEINCISASVHPKYSSAVFDKASYFEHSCRPNSFWIIVKTERAITVRALAPIQKGEPITVSYVDTSSGTVDRRAGLAEMKYFYCSCERCKDPTEFGTMFNAVKCIDCKCNGYMLPPTFLVSKDEKIPNYACDKCDATMTSEAVEKIMNNVTLEYSKIDEKNPLELKKFVEKQSKILHRNNYKIFDAEYNLAMSSQSSLKVATAKRLREYIKLYKKLTYLMTNLMPGKYFQRGLILYQMHACNNALILKEKPKSSKLLDIVQDSKDLLTEAHRLLLRDPIMDVLTEKVLRELRELSAMEKQCLKNR